MRRDDPETRLERLREAVERVSANLVELEIDSGRQLLEASALEGEAAARWSSANAALSELWRRQGLLEALLGQAEALRGGRRSEELRALLDGPSIELSSTDVPLAERSLLASAHVAERCSAEELLPSMSRAFDEVKTTVTTICAAWESMIPQLDSARRLLAEANRLADELGEPGRRELEEPERTLDALSHAVSTDPLSVGDGEIERLVFRLREARDELEGGVELKRGFEARISAARELLQRVRAAVAEARAAREELMIKILDSAPPPLELRVTLEPELGAISGLAERGDWRQARSALEQWTTRCDAELEAARRACEAGRAPLQARNQLRSLLDAYQVKAKRLGVLEDPGVADLFARAQDELYTAPTDLGRASQLVRGYQQALAGGGLVPEALQ
jgi:hypothetical protein